MKLAYNIIWFENDHSAINGFDIKKIETFLNDRGFDMNLLFILWTEPRSTVEIPYKYIIHKDYSHKDFWNIPLINADLILMDKDLEGEMDGDKIIEYIRDHSNDIYCDVLFYSTWKSEEDLRKIVQRDGLYFSNRGDVERKATNVIIVSIKKTQDLNNLRGLVMAETSEIDEWNRRILSKICKHYNSSITISPWLTSGINEIKIWRFTLLKTYSQEWAIIKVIYDFDKTISSQLYKGIYYFWRSSQNSTWLCTTLDWFDIYIDKTKRNILAHQPEEETSTRSCMKIKDTATWNIVEFYEQDLRDIRTYIREHKKVLVEFYNVLP